MAKRDKKITVGGQFYTPSPDVQMTPPKLWHLDTAQWAMAISQAKRWDWSRRVDLYNIYESCLLDTHLTGVVRKRRIAISQFPIEFRKRNKPVDEVNKEIHSPWFRKFLKTLLDVELFGFSAYQFYREENGLINFTQIDHRHIDPHKKQILRLETDLSGANLDSFPNTLFLGDESNIGELAKACPWVLWKRNSAQDWAQFCQVFGMPIREFTYDASDPNARLRIAAQAQQQGSNALYIHDKEDGLNLIEPNRNGSIDLYQSLQDQCNQEISVLILGNTLTTNVGEHGTQALGTVHQQEENAIQADDRGFVLDVLNYNMTTIFNNLGINTKGGEFVYAEKQDIDTSAQADIVTKMNAIGLPMDDDYLYDTFGIEKPKDYDKQVADKQAQKDAMQKAIQQSTTDGEDDDQKKTATDFFVKAHATVGKSTDNPKLDW